MEQTKKRYYIIDGIRGVAIINMILYHLFYDLVYMFGVNLVWFRSEGAYIWEQCICTAFILVSGICCHFGKRKLKRGLLVFALGCGISLFTLFFMPSQVIWFGILNMLGLSMLIMIPSEKILKKISPAAGLSLSLLLFVFTKGVCNGFLGIGDIPLIKLPDCLYSFNAFAFLGFPEKGFFSSDYFPLIPWIFVFFAGYFLWSIIKGTKAERLMEHKVPVLQSIGRYSLIIYIVHQPIIYGILYLMFNLI